MATVYIPASLRVLTGGRASVEVEGGTVRQIIDNLERAWPGLRDRLMDQDRLRANISVAVEGEVSPLGLLEQVPAAGEVHFVAAIKGGSLPHSPGCGRLVYANSSFTGSPVRSSSEFAIFTGRPMGLMYSFCQSIPRDL